MINNNNDIANFYPFILAECFSHNDNTMKNKFNIELLLDCIVKLHVLHIDDLCHIWNCVWSDTFIKYVSIFVDSL